MFARARLQLSAAYALVLALTVALLGTAAYAVARHQLDDEINRSLSAAIVEVEQSLLPRPIPAATPPPRDEDAGDDEDDGRSDDKDDEDEHDKDDGPVAGISPDVFFVRTDASGSVLENPRRVELEGIDFPALVASYGAGDVRQDVSTGDSHYRLLTAPVQDADGSYVMVGRSLTARDRQLRTLAMVFGGGGGVALALSGFGGYWLAGRALRPIQQSIERQRRFVSDASHELRTPISVVKANNELLLRHPDQTIEANLDQVEAIAVESEHMARLVADLLTLARADEGRAELARERLDLGALAAEVARDMEPIAAARGIDLRAETASSMVDGDSQRLRQLVTILLDNALKYTPQGGSVSVRCSAAGRHVDLSVTDTGPGIAAADQERVFDRFHRVGQSRSRAEGGTGLGLAIARWIAEAHGGRLALRSRLGEGSTFTFRVAGSQ